MYKIRFRRDHFETCNIWAKRKGFFVVIKILSPMDSLTLPGAIYIMVKHEKNVYKIRLQSNFFKPATNAKSDKGLYALALGLYTCIKSLKMCIKSEFEEIILKLATYGQREKAFLLSSKFCPQYVICPCPGSIYMYKSIKIYTRTRCQVSVYRTTGPLVGSSSYLQVTRTGIKFDIVPDQTICLWVTHPWILKKQAEQA